MNVIEKGQELADDLFDTPAFKLARSRDPSTSHDAADALDVSKMERLVLSAIISFGSAGCISDDVLNILPDYRYSTITARYKQLKEKGLVFVDQRKRKGQSGRQQLIMWSKEFYIPTPFQDV
jgi:hypothetical protein